MNPEAIQAQVVRMADLSWAAGVLDVEGNFSAPERTGKQGHFQPRITYRATRRVATAHVCKELQRIFGGQVTHGAPGTRGRAIWTVSGAKACLEIDELLLPYMRVRTRRVQLHAELCRMIREFKPASFEERALPKGELQERYRVYSAMCGL